MNVDEFFATMLARDTERDLQLEIGPSELMGCRRRVWHRLQQTPTVNLGVLKMPAWMGRILHAELEREAARQDVWGDRYLLEHAIEHGGITSHVDLIDTEDHELVDWKTSTKANLSPAKFPKPPQRVQVMTYGRAARARGHDIRNVVLVGIPRNGTERDVVVHREPYDERLAIMGEEWLDSVAQSPLPPIPTERVSFCRGYCQFYDPTEEVGCPGMR